MPGIVRGQPGERGLPPECALMNKQLLIAGGGIGGMALALAASRQGVEVDLL